MSTSRRLLVALASVGLLLPGCSGNGDGPGGGVPAPVVVPVERAEVPEGWTVHRGAGFTVATPPEWMPRADVIRLAPEAALEVGVPYTGQPVALPLLLGFVERERVGPLGVREDLLRLQLEQALPTGTTLGSSKRVEVAGAVDALSFDAVYTTTGGTSVLGTPVAPVTVRQRELIVETPGLPKYGLRFTAPLGDFDEQLWQQVLRSLTVLPGAATVAPTPSA